MLIIVAAILAIFVYGMIAAMLGTILPDLSKKFGLSPKQNGTIATAQAIGLVIASLAVGPLIDTEGKKIGLLLGLALVTVALGMLPRSKGYGMILAFMLVLGLGGGIIVTGANALASDVNAESRATTLNLLNLFFGLGGLATPFISANLLGRDSTKLCYLTAVLAAITLGVHFIAPIPGAPAGGAAAMPDFGVLLSSPTLLLLSAVLFLYVAAEVGVWNWLVRHLVAQGIPESRALNTLSLGFALGLLIGRVAVSPILLSVPATQVTLGASIVMAITTFMMLQAKTPTMAGVWVFLAGVAMAPMFPTALAIIGDRFPQGTATAMGIAITCGWLGLVASSPIIGAIAGDDPKRLKKALLLLPAVSLLLVVVNLAL